ncbi:MAG TPA: hypothetical protein PLM14_09315 [Candidatus Hydrogenedentes bacterium]|mgnify:CR=1 FL=1|nr:hypothetical protein [Candidatus Hydrogenedentota bacterium]HQE83186.1 hypothetical protein [Candidatus Hydrogenedentota bacterium]HQH50793.1 hypothetical protein [Candidatus Hydrogenedentota bacterium]HQM47731.1 hypothetical protein [Candidatus Hydrogenedentota bacterium]
MAKKRKIEIHQSEDLAQIDDELELALEQLESANLTVGGLLTEIDLSNKKEEGTSEDVPLPDQEEDTSAKTGEHPPDTTR